MNADLAQRLIQGCGALLLDFDGPMTALLPSPRNAELARASAAPLLLAGLDLPTEIGETTDHLAVIRWTAANAPEHLQAVEEISAQGEVAAAHTSPVTEGLGEVLQRCAHKVVVVTNNAPEAPRALLQRLGDRYRTVPICGRPGAQPELMKPSPFLVQRAATLAGRQPAECVMIGDHASDVVAAHAAGATAIGFAKSARHRDEVAAANADAIIGGWADVLP